ncbi:substrate-binding domain-containing protein [Georgenia sp. EYE_87]|uniref:sugar ABC transporter substrate-binding protein n=1 Tax=Georgenia sp. EYE_87 TaxID=2853448 RepID=UPI00200667D6|nr:substrate-binding domain-containing protein [Georgenia sp. EYE_87]MCK6210447.1 substrate-binding domain-containing protein [Georgenia sp. EYE_87]
MKKSVKALWGGAVAASALLLAACGGATPAPEATAAAGGAGTADAGPAVAAAQEMVDRFSGPVEEFTPPGPALGDLSALEGKTVYYIPANYKIPLFHLVGDGMARALATAGVDVQVCDGEASPASMASCLAQAVDAKADAVVSGSIPDELASVAFQSVRDAGIPLLYMLVAPEGPGEPDKVGYLTPDNVQLQALNANWIIADSGGQADVLVVKVTDTPATTLWTEQGALATYEEACPDCNVTVVETNTGQLQKLPSLVSSALVRNPDITHVQVPFDVIVQPTVQGLQSAGKVDGVTVSSSDGTLAVMQMLGEGRSIGSEIGTNLDALGWYGADQVLRMMSGEESVQKLEFPYRRIFTADNVGELDLTPEGEASGSWFGGTDYQDGFKELWGVN